MRTQEERDKDDCTVAACKCGRIVAAVVTASMTLFEQVEIEATAKARGTDLRHMTAAEVRSMPWGCRCGKEARPCGNPIPCSAT